MDRINIITLGTRDIAASLEFYRNMGFEATVVGDGKVPEIVFFRISGSKLALFPLEKLAAETGIDPSYEVGFNGITLAYNAKSEGEVDQVLKDAESFGGKVSSAAKATEWGGYGGYFTDLDGYTWEVAFGPDWEFDDDNMLII
ncbi:MAG TPA: VOC family protein [Candidatus Salinicoccus stercoripullorum]|uniref:VOC family protein n=1 Tax=Candidatus Salinicoccus stercoripullorum TaxID=2838756 RepID=A0A9D1QGX2_9STAP|nr:VOC family protein [Candidatus Salinicoccus stercoripullorum]